MSLEADIVSSFPKLAPESSGFLPDAATDDEMRQLTGDIGNFYIDDVPPYLGALLYWSARKPPTEPWALERLIYYLNANLDTPFFAGSEMGRDSDEIASERRHRLDRQSEFARLAPVQMAVVRDWLREAQSWACMKPLAKEVSDALGYWSGLVARHSV